MASKPDKGRCFIDYLSSLLLLCGLLFFQQDVAAQPKLEVEIKPAQSCSLSNWNSPDPECISPIQNTFCIRVSNKGNALEDKWEWLWIIPIRIEPIITIKVDLPEGVIASNPTKSDNQVILSETGDLESNGHIFKSISLEGNIAGKIVATVSYEYEDESDFSEEGDDEILVLSQPLPGSLGGDQRVCRNNSHVLGVEGEDLFAQGATKSFKWEWASKATNNWQEIEGATGATYNTEPVIDTIRYRRTSIATLNNLPPCESAPVEIELFPKICQVASNPMMRMHALPPQEDREE